MSGLILMLGSSGEVSTIEAPPGEPTASHGLPDLSTIVGDMLDLGRLAALSACLRAMA